MVENVPGISAHDYDLAMLYDAQIERYEQVAPDWGLPMMAVRLMAKRVGFDAILKGLELYGVPWAVERCRYEMTARQEFFARIVAKLPFHDLVEAEGVADELAHDLAVFDSLQASTRLLKFLDRLLRRERARQLEQRGGITKAATERAGGRPRLAPQGDRRRHRDGGLYPPGSPVAPDGDRGSPLPLLSWIRCRRCQQFAQALDRARRQLAQLGLDHRRDAGPGAGICAATRRPVAAFVAFHQEFSKNFRGPPTPVGRRPEIYANRRASRSACERVIDIETAAGVTHPLWRADRLPQPRRRVRRSRRWHVHAEEFARCAHVWQGASARAGRIVRHVAGLRHSMTPDDMITVVVSEPVNILSLKINAVHAREAHMADGRLRKQRAVRQACGGGSARLRRTARPARCSRALRRRNAWPSGEAQVAEHGLAVA